MSGNFEYIPTAMGWRVRSDGMGCADDPGRGAVMEATNDVMKSWRGRRRREGTGHYGKRRGRSFGQPARLLKPQKTRAVGTRAGSIWSGRAGGVGEIINIL